MNLNGRNYVRFANYASDQKSSSSSCFDWFSNHTRNFSFSSVRGFMRGIGRGFSISSEKIKSFIRKWSLHDDDRRPAKSTISLERRRIINSKNYNILDPQEPFLQTWNKVFVFACLIAVFLDPLFFYIPVVDSEKFCLSIDKNLEIIACVLRTFNDLFYVFHIILQFRTGFIAPSSRIFGRGELIKDPKAIAKRYLRSYFIIDVLAILPLPQSVILIVIPAAVKAQISKSQITKDLLKIVILCQYIPRFLRMYPLYNEVTRTSGQFKTPWAGAAFNLFIYMLASHIIGAFWYLFSVERRDNCWRIACDKNQSCRGGNLEADHSFLNSSCPLLEPEKILSSDDFDFGIFLDALQSQIIHHKFFMNKFLYCFWWGLRNLSALGQNLKTSSFADEILFAISISVMGLVLFSLLIGNMQKYLQSITVRVEEMRVKRQDAEQWMSQRMLPENLKERIRRYEQYKWQETSGVEEESLIRNLPKDLRRDIKRHLCLSLLINVPIFKKMDEQLLDAMCSFLKPVLYTENSCIVRKGDPVDEMLFIMRGDVLSITTNGGTADFFNEVFLKAGNFCGEELLTWALDPNSSSSLPISTRTVRAVKDVEAFSLMADDLKCVASQFRRLHSKQLQHAFRFYSQQWKTWGACFIQAAWRRHCRRKIERSIREAEDRMQDAALLLMEEKEEEGNNNPNFGSTIYASRFAANMLGALKRNHHQYHHLPHNNIAKVSPRLRSPPLLLQKPHEPDFSVEHRS